MSSSFICCMHVLYSMNTVKDICSGSISVTTICDKSEDCAIGGAVVTKVTLQQEGPGFNSRTR